MISALNLFWIVPVCAAVGFFLTAVCAGGR